jgi:acetyl-CoA carboxylase biotin carboxyl carrier protein
LNDLEGAALTGDINPASSPDQDLIRLMWQQARDLLSRLEGSTVRRLSVQAGNYKVEIELEPAAVGTPTADRRVSLSAVDAERATAAADTRVPVVAPLVGTFYRSPQPNTRPFIQEGDVVEPGQTVGIVEAMKIMNQVASEHHGRVAEIAVNDGDWVEFHQPLVYLEPLEAGSEASHG